jgi:hypothetical protein
MKRRCCILLHKKADGQFFFNVTTTFDDIRMNDEAAAVAVAPKLFGINDICRAITERHASYSTYASMMNILTTRHSSLGVGVVIS